MLIAQNFIKIAELCVLTSTVRCAIILPHSIEFYTNNLYEKIMMGCIYHYRSLLS
jgi:hypothetical protein